MKSALNFLENFDIFGAPLTPQIDHKKSVQRSIIGGVTTILIFSTSIAYSVAILYQWQTNQLAPKIQRSAYVSDFKLLDLNYDVVRFHFWKSSPELIDPFETNILLPILSYTVNYSFVETVVLRLSNKTSYDGNNYVIPEMKLGFTNIQGNLLTTSEMFIYFIKCQDELLPQGEKCASNEIIEQFNSQPGNTILMELSYKTLDSSDKMVKTSAQQFIIQIEPNSCYNLNTFLSSNLYQVNDAFLFGSPSYSEYIDGAIIQTQTSSLTYCTMAFGYETYTMIYIAMSGSQTKSIYDYPRMSDILANIGSIISTLFLVKYIILHLNNSSLTNTIIRELIVFYYPQFTNINYKKNWRGKISKVYYCGQALNNQQQEQFSIFIKKITREVKLKISVVNMCYEISRLYLLLRSKKSISEIKKVHQLGLRFNFIPQTQNYACDTDLRFSSLSTIEIQKPQQLLYEDIGVLSLDQRVAVRSKEDNVPDELENNFDYYDMNRVMSVQFQ